MKRLQKGNKNSTYGFNLSDYLLRREKVIESLQEIKDVASKLGLSSTIHKCEGIINRLQNDCFNIVVVGEFSRGKSTVINALLGTRFLPAAVRPTTAVLTKIVYSEKQYIKMFFHGRKKSPRVISYEEFCQTVAPPEPSPEDETESKIFKEKIGYLRKIEYIEIGFPTRFCSNGVVIVDTPGTNDLDPLREEITYKYIPQSDAAIMVLSATMPLSESELGFIRDRILANDIRRIFFVVNFRNHLENDAEVKKIYEFIRNNLEPYVSNPRVFLVDAKGALNYRRKISGELKEGDVPNWEQTGFEQFEESLARFLNRERGKAKLEKPVREALKLCNEITQSSLSLAYASLEMSTEEVKRKIDELKPRLSRLEEAGRQTLNWLANELDLLGSELTEHLRKGLSQVARSAEMAVDNYRGGRNEKELNREIERAVAPVQTKLINDLQQRNRQRVEQILKRASERLDAAWDQMGKEINQTFLKRNLSLADSDIVSTDLNPLENLSLSSGDATPLIAGGVAAAVLLSFLAWPLAIFGGILVGTKVGDYLERERESTWLDRARIAVKNRYSNNIKEQAKNFSHRYEEYKKKIQKEVEENVNRRIGDLFKQLEQLKKEKAFKEQEIEAKKAYLSQLERQLKEAGAKLLQIKQEYL